MSVIVWADIPVKDLTRASEFYARVTGLPVTVMPGSADVAVIGGPDDGVSADLYVGGNPGHDGPTVYLGSDCDIDGIVSRVVEAGGKVLAEKAFMGDMVGWIAFFLDTEGNRVGVQQAGE